MASSSSSQPHAEKALHTVADQVVQLLQETVQQSPTHNKLLWDVISKDPKLVCTLANGILKESNNTGVTDENVGEELKATLKLLKIESYEIKLNRLEQNITVKPVEEIKARLKGKIFPPDILETIEDCALKLSTLGSRDYEYRETKIVFDWLTSLPWGLRGGNNFNFNYEEALSILNEKVYGLDNVKINVCEFIRSNERNWSNRMKIICLVGPHGTGKSILAKSIAEIMQRNFAELPCMGVTDQYIIKGSSNNYKSAGKPGIVLRCLKELQTENPVLLIKNIDLIFKNVSYSYSQVSSEVLQILHPNQNKQFYDQFLQMSFDFSNIIFVCTSTCTDNIPSSLRPFMEIIQVPGFILEEKQLITSKFLVPQLLKEFGGTTDVQVEFENGALELLLQNYSTESGVNELRKGLSKIILKLVGDKSLGKCIVHVDDVRNISSTSYLSNLTLTSKPGVAKTSYLTENGGETCFIEAMPRITTGDTDIKFNGFPYESSQNVAMPPSTFAVTTYTNKSFFINFRSLTKQNIQEDRSSEEVYNNYRSIGGAIAVAVWSAYKEKRLNAEMGILMEVTTTGMILPLDHLEERVKALVRVGIKEIILPVTNEQDVKCFPKILRDFIKIHLVNDMYQAIELFQKWVQI